MLLWYESGTSTLRIVMVRLKLGLAKQGAGLRRHGSLCSRLRLALHCWASRSAWRLRRLLRSWVACRSMKSLIQRPESDCSPSLSLSASASRSITLDPGVVSRSVCLRERCAQSHSHQYQEDLVSDSRNKRLHGAREELGEGESFTRITAEGRFLGGI